jgi:DNA-binding Lrp family transcriptional regulator
VTQVAVNAYILIQTEVGKAAEVARRIRDLSGVVAADDVTGPYDVIVRAEVETMNDLGHYVVGPLQLLEGITKTLTCPVVDLG